VDNIKMDFVGIGRCGMGWIDLAQDRDRWKAFGFHKVLEVLEYLQKEDSAP
jgi:hypothetical protein